MLILPLDGRSAAGRFTLVDPEDFAWAQQRRWPYDYRTPRSRSKQRRGVGDGFAGRRGSYLHRLLLERTLNLDGCGVWHLNGWGLDNRRCNLIVRAVGFHRRSLDYRNVHKIGPACWRVVVCGQKIGDYDSLERADSAYEEAARAAGFITPQMRRELLSPVMEFLESRVELGQLVRFKPESNLIEDRYRIPTSKIAARA